ncbi:MAG: glycosyltransferase, partial [Chloroflexota bacterium]|nr:glycosyltransferase [Chloroflexota bacterium]
MSESRPSISAFFPCYNDGGTIASMVIEMTRVLRELTDDYEVVVVENGSTDYTNDVLDELETLYAADAPARGARFGVRVWGGAVTAGGRGRVGRWAP